MNKNMKRAFTITELVIVIAVVAILAAVLIPTFSNVIEKANVSNDTVLVRNLNEALIIAETTEGKPQTMHDALTAVAEQGYTVEKLTPRSTGHILWEQTSNRFVLVDSEGTFVLKDDATTAELGYTYWKITSDLGKVSTGKYSYYLADEVDESVLTEALSVSTGVDVGNNSNVSISYANNGASATAQNVIFRTNGGELTVNGSQDTVSHYGSLVTADVQAVANNSYHEYGTILGNMKLGYGRVVLENKSEVATVVVTTTSDSLTGTTLDKVVKIENNSGNSTTVAATDSTVASNLESVVTGDANVSTDAVAEDDLNMFAGGLGTEASPYLIETAKQFANIGQFSDSMSKGSPYNFKMITNIDLSEVSFGADKEWVSAYFCGTLDGGSYNLIANTKLSYIFADASHNVVIKNLNYYIADKNILLCSGVKLGVKNTVLLDNVDYYAVEGAQAVQLGQNEGIVYGAAGYSYVEGSWVVLSDGLHNELTVKNCDVYVDIVGVSYNAVFFGGNIYYVTVNLVDSTYHGTYYGEDVSLALGNPAGLDKTLYGLPKFTIVNVRNAGNMFGTNRQPLFAASTGTTEPKNSQYFSLDEASDLGNVKHLSDSSLNISKESDGRLAITKPSATGVKKYVLTLTGGTRLIAPDSENSSYRFSIDLGSLTFDGTKSILNYKDGKMATVEQYKEIDPSYTFDEENAIQVYLEDGARFCVVENNGTIYYVFDFENDFYKFIDNTDTPAIVDVNSAMITVYDESGLPIAQKKVNLIV